MAEKTTKEKARKGSKDKDKKRSKGTSDAVKKEPKISLLADEKNIDSKLSSLFAAKPARTSPDVDLKAGQQRHSTRSAIEDQDGDHSLPRHTTPQSQETAVDEAKAASTSEERATRKRKRKDQADDLEDNYMRKLARQGEQEFAEHREERSKSEGAPQGDTLHITPVDNPSANQIDVEREEESAEEDGTAQETAGDADGWSPPQHETQAAASNELDKAGRTVFVGNVSTAAITTKSARRTLEKHLTSFFDKLTKPSDAKGDKPTKPSDTKGPTPKLESLRFRSTPYAPTLPKKAAYARGEVMSTTAQSTNAYAVYSTPALAREACRRLNGTIVLDRHIRVDSVAHPAPVANKRCVFVGGLSFVDDETNIIAANEAEGREKRKSNQKPSDVEEGLWRLFAKHGTVESVRVVRDKGSRVGIGIAYVQFTDENAVEAALSEDGKKAPPMLPRKLRVTRAKAMKKSKPALEKPRGKPVQAQGYQRKITPGEATLRGRLGKLMGKAAAATASPNFQGPKAFVFEGHRASSKQKNTGLKLGRKTKPTNRGAKRAAAYKTGAVKKRST